MKRFLAVFIGSQAAMEKWRKLDPKIREAREADGLAAWKAWREKHATSIVEEGAPLGKTKRVAKTGSADHRNNLAVYVVVQAESHDAAAKLFENHPHFTIFPGESVEVMECLPVPAER